MVRRPTLIFPVRMAFFSRASRPEQMMFPVTRPSILHSLVSTVLRNSTFARFSMMRRRQMTLPMILPFRRMIRSPEHSAPPVKSPSTVRLWHWMVVPATVPFLWMKTSPRVWILRLHLSRMSKFFRLIYELHLAQSVEVELGEILSEALQLKQKISRSSVLFFWKSEFFFGLRAGACLGEVVVFGPFGSASPWGGLIRSEAEVLRADLLRSLFLYGSG